MVTEQKLELDIICCLAFKENCHTNYKESDYLSKVNHGSFHWTSGGDRIISKD